MTTFPTATARTIRWSTHRYLGPALPLAPAPPADEAGNAGGVTARPPDEVASTGLPAGARKTAAAGAGTCKRAATATAEKGYRRGRPRRR